MEDEEGGEVVAEQARPGLVWSGLAATSPWKVSQIGLGLAGGGGNEGEGPISLAAFPAIPCILRLSDWLVKSVPHG